MLVPPNSTYNTLIINFLWEEPFNHLPLLILTKVDPIAIMSKVYTNKHLIIKRNHKTNNNNINNSNR